MPGTKPIAAKTEGRERIPKETVSAIMTIEMSTSLPFETLGEQTHASLPRSSSASLIFLLSITAALTTKP